MYVSPGKMGGHLARAEESHSRREVFSPIFVTDDRDLDSIRTKQKQRWPVADPARMIGTGREAHEQQLVQRCHRATDECAYQRM